MVLPPEIVALHDEVAGRIKEYETRTGKNPPIEVLNELRYTLRALVDWSNNPADPPAEIQKIRHGLMCAYHDLVDGLLIEFSRQLDSAMAEYPDATIKVLGERRLQMLDVVNRIESKIAASRKDRSARATIYEEIYGEFDVLTAQLKFFDQVALPEIISESDRLEVRERKATRDKRIGWVIGIGGVALGFVFYLLG